MAKLLRLAATILMAVLMSGFWGIVGAQAAPAGQSTLPAEVLRTDWTLQYFSEDAQAAGKDVTSSHITIKFEADGNLNGSGGCNSYSSTYTVSGQKMTISDKIISTLMFCAEPVMNNEQQYFRLLPTVSAYALKGGNLNLIYGDGATAMMFIPTPGQGNQAGQ